MITSYAQTVLAKSKGKFVLLDSNLLILLLLGSYDIRLIKSFKRLNDFTAVDLRVLQDLSRSFKIATSAHILTEASNLINNLPQHLRQNAMSYMASRIAFLKENVVAAAEVATTKEFLGFGITDAVLVALCDSHVLVTNDGRLATHLRSKRQLVLTLDDLRSNEPVRMH